MTTWNTRQLRYAAQATVFTDMAVGTERVAQGAGAPNYAQVAGGGYAYKLGVGDSLRFSVQCPHSVMLGSTIEAHCHCGPDGTDATGGNAQFEIDVAWANDGESFSASVPLTSLDIAMGTGTNTHLRAHIGFYTAATHGVNSGMSMIGLGTLTRVAADADEYTGDVWVYSIDFHVEMDSLGSDEPLTKFV